MKRQDALLPCLFGKSMGRVAVYFVTVLLVISQVLPVQANHYDYVAVDPSKQSPPVGVENYVAFSWWYGGITTWWSDPTILPQVQSAINILEKCQS
jgi:hypothetical protein